MFCTGTRECVQNTNRQKQKNKYFFAHIWLWRGITREHHPLIFHFYSTLSRFGFLDLYFLIVDTLYWVIYRVEANCPAFLWSTILFPEQTSCTQSVNKVSTNCSSHDSVTKFELSKNVAIPELFLFHRGKSGTSPVTKKEQDQLRNRMHCDGYEYKAYRFTLSTHHLFGLVLVLGGLCDCLRLLLVFSLFQHVVAFDDVLSRVVHHAQQANEDGKQQHVRQVECVLVFGKRKHAIKYLRNYPQLVRLRDDDVVVKVTKNEQAKTWKAKQENWKDNTIQESSRRDDLDHGCLSKKVSQRVEQN